VKTGDGWRVTPNPIPRDTSQEDVEWISKYRMPQSVKCFEQPLHLQADVSLPRTYIHCTRYADKKPFAQFASRATSDSDLQTASAPTNKADVVMAAEPPACAVLMKLVPTTQITFGSDYPYFRLSQMAWTLLTLESLRALQQERCNIAKLPRFPIRMSPAGLVIIHFDLTSLSSFE
jgi:hypothetical protein